MRLARTKDAAGRFLLDVAKLVIGGVILAGVMQQGFGFAYLNILAGISVAICVALGFLLIAQSDNETKKEDTL
ncbi:MAG: ABC transporter permease [Prevotellaceae bacterium]|jgi:uncharacterized membrane protein YraQ (UPF0718 family)|nr:ABC transporter permease [Prevotellaceae bacterium]